MMNTDVIFRQITDWNDFRQIFETSEHVSRNSAAFVLDIYKIWWLSVSVIFQGFLSKSGKTDSAIFWRNLAKSPLWKRSTPAKNWEEVRLKSMQKSGNFSRPLRRGRKLLAFDIFIFQFVFDTSENEPPKVADTAISWFCWIRDGLKLGST